jgi:hypothetical protein
MRRVNFQNLYVAGEAVVYNVKCVGSRRVEVQIDFHFGLG